MGPHSNYLISQLCDKAFILDITFMYSNVEKIAMENVLRHIHTTSISVCSIKGSGVTPLATKIIELQPQLKSMALDDTSEHIVELSDLKAMCEQANKRESLQELKLVGLLLHSCLASLPKRIKLSVCCRSTDGQQLERLSSTLTSSSSKISEVDLSCSNFKSDYAGPVGPVKLISQIMIQLQSLLILKLRNCGITSETIFQIENKIKASKKQVPVKEVDLLGNRLDCSSDLDGLLGCCPNLSVLLFTYEHESQLPHSHEKVKVTVATCIDSCTTVLQFSERMRYLEKLFMINVGPDFLQFNMSVPYKMRVLHLLDVPEYKKAVESLSQNLNYMAMLQELYMCSTSTKHVESLEHIFKLIRNIPKSLTRLNLYGFESSDLISILQEKERLCKLKELNIGSAETPNNTIQIIFQELQQLNSDINVYSDGEEFLISLQSYSNINPPSKMNLQSTKEANDMLEVLTERNKASAKHLK